MAHSVLCEALSQLPFLAYTPTPFRLEVLGFHIYAQCVCIYWLPWFGVSLCAVSPHPVIQTTVAHRAQPNTQDLQRFCEDHGLGIWLVPSHVVPEAPQKTKEGLGSPAPSSSAWRSSSPEKQERSVLTPEDVRRWRADFERLYAQEE